MPRRSDPTVVGVLLAAGRGTRFDDGDKLLADLDGEPVVRRAARCLVEADLQRACAVLGHDADRVAGALADLPLEVVRNPDFEAGQSTSVARGVEWADERAADAAIFALGDLPRVSPATVRVLVDRWRETGAGIVVPEHRGRRGNPVLFDARHFDALERVEGDVGGRELIRHGEDVVRIGVDDPGILQDVDTEADLDELRGSGESAE